MEQKIYSSKELNEIIGYVDKSGHNSSKEQLMTRCKNAGLIIEAIDTPLGLPNKYIIIENNFHLEGEEWIDCYNNEEWEVSNLGRIRRKSTKKLMGSIEATSGYLRVTMLDKKTGKQTGQMVHRLVFFSFNPDYIEYIDKIQVDHINGIRTDSRLCNLQPLASAKNIEQRDQNQGKIRLLTTQLIMKFGYEKTEEMLKKLLTNKN